MRIFRKFACFFMGHCKDTFKVKELSNGQSLCLYVCYRCGKGVKFAQHLKLLKDATAGAELLKILDAQFIEQCKRLISSHESVRWITREYLNEVSELFASKDNCDYNSPQSLLKQPSLLKHVNSITTYGVYDAPNQ